MTLKTAVSLSIGVNLTIFSLWRNARRAVCAVAGILALAVSTVAVQAQQTVVIGGSGLPAIEVNLERALAPPSAPTGRASGLLPDNRPPLVDISAVDPSVLKPPPRRPSMAPAPDAAAPSTPKKASSSAARQSPTPRRPRSGTRIPATSLAAEVGTGSTQMAALPKTASAPPPPKVSAPAPKPPPPAPAPVPAKAPQPAPTVAPPTTAKPTPPAPPPAATPKPQAARAPASETAAKAPTRASPPPVPSLPKQDTTAPAPKAPPPVAKAAPPPLTPPKPALQTTAAPPPVKTAPKAPETKVAALPSAQTALPQGIITRLVFAAGKADVSGPLAEQLDNVARTMRTRDDRLLLQAYAAAVNSGSASGSRRLSLARALEVRSYLIRKGLKSTRIDVRALGTSDPSGPADRVDILLLTR